MLVNTKGFAVSFYGLLELPKLMGKNEGLHELMEELHEFFYLHLLFMVVLHAAGALKHRFLDTGPDIDVMKRMFGKAWHDRIKRFIHVFSNESRVYAIHN